MRKIALIIAAMLLAMPATMQAQSSNLLYGSSRNPMMNSVNPAFFPNNTRMFLSLPNVNMDFTSPVAYSGIFSYDPEQQKAIIDANQLLRNFTDDRMLLNLNANAAGMGINFGPLFVTASVQAKANVSFSIPKGLSTLVNDGNINNLGPDNPLELLDGEIVTVQSYTEGAVGLGLTFGKKLTFGARAKLLVGVADVSNAGSSLKLTTAEDFSSIAADMDINMHVASAVHIFYDSVEGKYDITYPEKVKDVPENYGFGLDLGFRFKYGILELSGSILDLGKGIHWKQNIQRIVTSSENNHIEFTGIDVSDVIHNGTLDSNLFQALEDSLKQMAEFKIIDDDSADYWTTVPTKINLGGMLHLTKGFSAGILFHGEFERGIEKVGEVFQTSNAGFHSNTSVLARINIADWFEIVGSMSVVTNNNQWSWINPGFGVTLTPFRRVQAYVFLDYISDMRVIEAKRFNMSAGVNLMFGRFYEKKKTKKHNVPSLIEL